MPMLLEDLAEEASASNRRVADRLDEEVRDLDKLRQAVSALVELRLKAVETARLSTDFALSRLPQCEGIMRSALAQLRKEPSGDVAGQLLRSLLDTFRTGQRLVRAARSVWGVSEQIGVVPERVDELDQAERRLGELVAEAQRALDHRASDWQPADPARLAEGLQLVVEGKTVNADEARARFRRNRS